MILIADSGATKTDWMTIGKDKATHLIHTQGINPFHQNEEEITRIVETELAEHCHNCHQAIEKIYFYGSGCLPETSAIVERALKSEFTQAEICINSDLLGAARAACQREKGIACILGTGSNSCLYDGENITDNVSPLGYILGDEGSGAYIGKRFISDCLKRQLPEKYKDGLMKEYGWTQAEILKRVYRAPQPSRFLASITPYIYKIRKEEEIHHLLTDCFEQFFRRNVMLYPAGLPVSFMGSIAWYFEEELKETAARLNISVKNIVKEPIDGLKEYHRNEL